MMLFHGQFKWFQNRNVNAKHFEEYNEANWNSTFRSYTIWRQTRTLTIQCPAKLLVIKHSNIWKLHENLHLLICLTRILSCYHPKEDQTLIQTYSIPTHLSSGYVDTFILFLSPHFMSAFQVVSGQDLGETSNFQVNLKSWINYQVCLQSY